MNDKPPDSSPAKSRPRSIASSVLLALASLAVAAAIVATYVDRQIFDSARFADHAVTALEQPQVRESVVNNVRDLIVTEISQDAVALRPLIDTVADSVIESTAFKRLFRNAVVQAHSAALGGKVDGAAVTIANIGLLVSQVLERLDPSLKTKSRAQFDDALVEVVEFDEIDSLASTAQTSHDLAKYLPYIALLLVLAAFLIAPRRLRAFERLGLSLIAAGALIVLGYFLARYVVLHLVVEAGASQLEVSELVWTAFMGGLIPYALATIALGVLIAAVADGTLSGLRLTDRLRWLGRTLSTPRSTPKRIGWSLLAIVVGGLIALNPATAVTLLIVLAGLSVIAAGLQELAMLAVDQSAIASEQTATAKPARKHRYLRIAVSLGIFVVMLITTLGVVRVSGDLDGFGVVQDKTACNGDAALCERPLDEVAFAATHNSMAEESSPSWFFPSQEHPVGRQLADGVRGLLIDVYFGFPGNVVYTDEVRSSPKARSVMREEFGDEFVDTADRVRRSLSAPEGVDPSLYLCHGFCELGATLMSETLDQTREFLENNPREVLIVILEDYVPASDMAEAIERHGLKKYAYKGPWGPEWPTLGEMIDDNQRLVLMTENAVPDVDWMHNAFESIQETQYHFSTVEQLESPKSCNESRGDPDSSMFLVNHWVDTAPAPRPSIAAKVNRYSFLSDRIERCQRRRGLLANLVAVDFYKEGDLFTVVDDLNDER